jgi:hypothetical protein
MRRYIAQHDEWLKQQLGPQAELPGPEALAIHLHRLQHLQHERLAHLLVLLGFAVMCLIALGLWLAFGGWALFALFALFLVMLPPYVQHYWLLENSVQRWIRACPDLEKRP